MTKFITEKRKANVGEHILITDAIITDGAYTNGSVGKVSRQCPVVRDLMYVEEWGQPVLDEEYEVIVSEQPRKQTKSERIAALEAEAQRQDERILDLERKVAELSAKPAQTSNEHNVCSANEQRKAIIAEAKAFVAGLQVYLSKGNADRTQGNHTYQEAIVNVEFHVNADKRAVTALVRSEYDNRLLEKAVAKAHPDDVFNADIGKAVALGRALGLDVKRFEKAVQPADFAQGHIIRYYGSTQKITQIDGERALVNTGGFHWTSRVDEEGFAIIDDTEAQY